MDYVVDQKSFVASNVSIGAGCVIEDSSIASGAKILPYSVITKSIVGKNCIVGPFANLREGSLLKSGSKIGTFVEVKNSIIGKNTKAAHLAYIGDAYIGENVNIGCGVVFCNYDGKRKHKTYVGDNVFIGANSNLVAPLFVGKDAFIAAGSTITKTVYEKERVIARARQVLL